MRSTTQRGHADHRKGDDDRAIADFSETIRLQGRNAGEDTYRDRGDVYLRKGGLTRLQYAVLAYLYVQPDIDQNGLAARLGIDRASTSQLVDHLKKAGYVEQRVSGTDRRARLLRLTRRGTKLREGLRPIGRAAEARILAPLEPTERETLVELLVRLVAANEVFARPGAGRRKPGANQSSLPQA